MAVLESVPPSTEAAGPPADPADGAPPTRPSRPGAVRLAALGLWGVVGSLLAYGVVQTAVKAAALFG